MKAIFATLFGTPPRDKALEAPLLVSPANGGLITSAARPRQSNVRAAEVKTVPFDVLPDNANRKGFLIYNASNYTVYVKLGDRCSASDYSFPLPTATGYEPPGGSEYTGKITACGVTASGVLQITELS